MISALLNLINTSLVIASAACMISVVTKPYDGTFVDYLKFQFKFNGLSWSEYLRISRTPQPINEAAIAIKDHLFFKTSVYKIGDDYMYFVGCFNNWYRISHANKLFKLVDSATYI